MSNIGTKETEYEVKQPAELPWEEREVPQEQPPQLTPQEEPVHVNKP